MGSLNSITTSISLISSSCSTIIRSWANTPPPPPDPPGRPVSEVGPFAPPPPPPVEVIGPKTEFPPSKPWVCSEVDPAPPPPIVTVYDPGDVDTVITLSKDPPPPVVVVVDLSPPPPPPPYLPPPPPPATTRYSTSAGKSPITYIKST